MRNDLFSGSGTYATTTDTFEGEFRKGEIVSGSHVDSLGNKHEGEFRNWLYHGEGQYQLSSGDSYTGTFSEVTSRAKPFLKVPMARYEGEMVDWVYHCKGKLRDAEGNIYEGGFEHGSYHGQGTLTLAEPVEGIGPSLEGRSV